MNIRNKIKIKADKYINAESLNKYIKSDALNKYILKPDSINSTFTTARAITAAFSNQKKKISTHLQHQQLPNLLKYTPKTIPKRPIYIILILLRIIYALLPAYIHPNEYYERTQLTDADKFLEPKSQQVLEFEKENPCNSIVPATLAIGIPFGFVKHIFNKIMDTELENYVNDSTLFIVYRLYFLALTFIIDICIYNIRSLQSRDPFQPLLLFSSSYLILTFYQRPFSNTLEEILLALSLWTFVACVPPRQANLRERKIKGSGAMFTKFMNGMYEIMPLAFGLVVTSIVFIIVDSLYFGSLNIVYNGKHEVTLENVMEVLNAPEKIASVRFTGQLIITPLNNFIKNLSVRVEPNCMNLFVNMPILYGPLYFLGIYYTIQSVSKATLRSRDLNKTVSIYCILMGLVGLTIVPQAETKYLESMGVFMVLALADKISYFVGKEK
ncbi:hypothetical protein LY90DRAFT_699910 [Neocallimastix californiae]|uniref:Uncharacterized protein n=1 Tax=Neocallimastix californiae TaxID=1754190 RepID=A0A1Y2EMC8_9FUNG|nr:hypothetical protein LY90DRAFT_699910 [Neocallimastix californiae]|eukprot:ORY72669.1 hypothetical protein LY90DRAFT_699910 [Neocallimastix californiae]